MSAISIDQLRYQWSGQSGLLLDIPHLSLTQGDTLFVQGGSGSGKSTLLNLIAGVLTPSSGEIRLLEQPFSSRNGRFRDRFRADHIGFIFQQFNLIPYLSVIDNVILSCRFSTRRRLQIQTQFDHVEEGARYWLERLNLPANLWHQPATRLSVGQQQRVAAARALMGAPELIIADEPTSALDQDNVDNFMRILTEQCQAINSSLIFVSHDRQLASWFPQKLSLTTDKEVAV